MFIQRQIANEIIDLINRFPVVGIVGPRQVGKTTLAKFLMKRIAKECLYLDLELPEDLNKLSDAQLFLEHHLDKCVVFDEVQQVPELFPILRALIDKNPGRGKYIVLGSASPELLRQSSESLAGRIAYKELAPFNLLEIINYSDISAHWFKGGFPPAFLSPTEKDYRLWMRNFVQTYLERDLPLLGLSVNPVLMRRFWSMLAHFHGGIWNASNFARSLELSVPVVNRYLDFLESAFIVQRLQPFFFNVKKRLVKAPKVYLRDSGLLHYLVGIPTFNDLLGNVLLGNSWEGYVIEQIRQIVSEEFELYYYRTHHGAESDLVLVKGFKVVASIEIKYASAPKISKGFLNSIEDLQSENNFVITPKSDTYPIRENVLVCNILDFLNNHLKKLMS